MWSYNHDLCHSGVIGMKWGVRLLTKQRWYKNICWKETCKRICKFHEWWRTHQKFKNRISKNQYNKMLQDKPSKVKNRNKKVLDVSSDLINQMRKWNTETGKSTQKLDLSKMTDQQPRDRINRTNLERQYNDMLPSRYGFKRQTICVRYSWCRRNNSSYWQLSSWYWCWLSKNWEDKREYNIWHYQTLPFPRYYGMFRDAVIRGEIPVCKEISMEMNRIDDLIANPGVYYDAFRRLRDGYVIAKRS